jgi:hypothetical protein
VIVLLYTRQNVPTDNVFAKDRQCVDRVQKKASVVRFNVKAYEKRWRSDGQIILR